MTKGCNEDTADDEMLAHEMQARILLGGTVFRLSICFVC